MWSTEPDDHSEIGKKAGVSGGGGGGAGGGAGHSGNAVSLGQGKASKKLHF